MQPALCAPDRQRLAGIHAKEIQRTVSPAVCEPGPAEPTRRKLAAAIPHVLAAENAEPKHFGGCQLWLEFTIEFAAYRHDAFIPIALLHKVVYDHLPRKVVPRRCRRFVVRDDIISRRAAIPQRRHVRIVLEQTSTLQASGSTDQPTACLSPGRDGRLLKARSMCNQAIVARRGWAPQKPQVECHEHQDDPNAHHQPFQFRFLNHRRSTPATTTRRAST